jgi:DNA invertase Pin-like site-specific DNA recombinase
MADREAPRPASQPQWPAAAALEPAISLVAASAPAHFIEDTPTAVLVRQVLGAIAEFENTTLVAKLAAARRRKRMATGEKVEGRKSHFEARLDLVKLAKALARKKPKGGKLSLRAISAELAAQGFLNERGRPFNPKSIAAMLAARTRLGIES